MFNKILQVLETLFKFLILERAFIKLETSIGSMEADYKACLSLWAV